MARHGHDGCDATSGADQNDIFPVRRIDDIERAGNTMQPELLADVQVIDHPVRYGSSRYALDCQLDQLIRWERTDGISAIVRCAIDCHADIDELSGFEIRRPVRMAEKKAFRVGSFNY